MSNKEQENTENQITLIAFAASNRNGGFTILKVGQVNFTYSCYQNGKTIGHIEIKGNYLVISKCYNKTSFSHKDINEDTCILLLAEDASSTYFHRAVLVSCVPEIAPAAFELLDSKQ